MNAFWIIFTGSIVATSCALLGCFLVLRRMTMIGDAISHAVLPGIVIAFLFSGRFDSFYTVLGAAMLGVFASFVIEFFNKKGNLQTDASIGVTFTSLFALGIILISVFTDSVDIDQDCVLYGELAYIPLNLWISDSGVILGPRATWISGSILLLIIAFTVICYRPLLLTTFDADFAATIGISTMFWHYTLMVIVSLTTVASFESVGAILVVAFLVVPAAAAYLLTNQLKTMLLIAIAIALLGTFGGYWLATWINGSIAAAMATLVGIFFLFAFLFSPVRSRGFKPSIRR